MALVLVTHRLANVRFCDRVHLLDGGRIVDSGTFESLRRSNEGFARMVSRAGIDHRPADR